MRVAIGGFYHETNTFSVASTGLAEFRTYQYASGSDLPECFRGTNSEIGGMVDGLEDAGHDLIPLLFASAVPSGLITRVAFEHILQGNLSLLEQAGQVDAVCLSLHGAAAAEGLADADGAFVKAVRQAIGPDIRLAVTLDYHANVSADLVAAADFVTIYRTYPHTDMATRGREAVQVITAAHLPAHFAMRKLPAVTVPLVQATADQPMLRLMHRFDLGLSNTATISNSVAMGFAYADSPNLGATVLVYGDDAASVEVEADALSRIVWEAREDLRPDLISLEALSGALAGTSFFPTVIVDPSDNIGGGSAGDGTEILRCLLESGQSAVIHLTDPEAAAECKVLGVGGAFDMTVGARVDTLHGAPLKLGGTVEWVGEATFRNSGSYMTGFVTSMGLAGVIRVGGLRVIVTSLRTMPFDPGVLTSVGITPQDQEVIVVKAAIAWRAAFGPIAKSILIVDTPGICPANLEQLEYHQSDSGFWPLDAAATF